MAIPPSQINKMKHRLVTVATKPQAEAHDRLVQEGFRFVKIREYPTRLKRKPIEFVLEMQKVICKPTTSSCVMVLVNNKGGVE